MADERRRLAADAWGSLLHAHAALVPVLDRELRQKRQLPLTWYDVLLELYHATDRRLRMSALSDRVTLSRTRVSRIVDELVRAELVRREPDPEDLRSSFAVLTSAGRTAYRHAAPVYLTAIEQHFARRLDREALAELGGLLEMVLGER